MKQTHCKDQGAVVKLNVLLPGADAEVAAPLGHKHDERCSSSNKKKDVLPRSDNTSLPPYFTKEIQSKIGTYKKEIRLYLRWLQY